MTFEGILEHFGLIEADFQREYAIDFSKDTLSWRRFLVLLSGLSGESAFIYTLSEEKKKKKEVIENTSDILQDIRRNIGGMKKR